jgi:hypothetical protein
MKLDLIIKEINQECEKAVDKYYEDKSEFNDGIIVGLEKALRIVEKNKED